ncbi:MAG: hypothetical protein ACRDST_18225 [Pseudonocardiaceae bacterium]
MVPLANAWRSGADTWDTAKRRAFANDLTNSQLIAVSAASNRAKATSHLINGNHHEPPTGAPTPGPGPTSSGSTHCR